MMNFVKSNRLKPDTAPVFFVVLLVTILLITWFITHLVRNITDQIDNELEIEMAGLERMLTDKIDHTFSIIQNINLQIEEDPKNKKHINEILKRYRTNPSLSDTFSWTLFSWSDENYQIVVDAKYGIMAKPFDLSGRDYVPLTKEMPGEFHLGKPVFGSTSKKWMIPGGVGAVDENGKYLGAVTIGFEIESLAKLLHKIVQNPYVKFNLLSQNGSPILYGDMKNFAVSETSDDKPYNQEINKVNSAKTGKVFDISLIKKRHAFLAKKMNDYPYILLLEYNKKAIISTVWNLTISRITEILSIAFGLMILLILLYREKQQSRKIIFLKQHAELANDAKSEFLTQSVHEFKNFVFGIQGCAEIIKGDLKTMISKLKNEKNSADNPEINELETAFDLSSEIIESTHDLTNFINDLIDINQAESGEFKINKSSKPFSIERIAKQSVKLLQKRAKNSDIILLTHIDPNLRLVFDLDPRRIKQIMLNLISNAIKYSPHGSVVEIFITNSTTKKVEIVIKDYGFGMSEDEIKTALQKYKTIENPNSKNVDSLGLGLPIVKFLVEKQDGILEIKSQKNKGTEIKVIL